MEKHIKQLNEIKKLGGSMRLAAEAWNTPWKTLISTILSARTLDETTIKVSKELYEKYPTPKDLGNAKLEDVEKIIKRVNFYRNKSKNIINCCKALDEKYKGKVPEDFGKLVELAGVGSKTANVFLSEYGHDTIGVDTHVSYISQYLGWVKSDKPEKIEEELRELFPKSYWKDLNRWLVRFGKYYTSRKQKNELLDKIKEI